MDDNKQKEKGDDTKEKKGGTMEVSGVLTLQALVALGLLQFLLGLFLLEMLLLRQVSLVVADDLAHVLEVVLGVLVLLLVRITLQDVDDLGTGVVTDCLARVAVGPARGGRVVRLEPFFELASRHVDELVKLLDDIGVGFHHDGRVLQ